MQGRGQPGVTGSYSFTVRVLPSGTPQTVTVAAGSCATIPNLPVDAVVEITETVPTGQTAALTVTPAGEERPCPTPAAARICVNVSGAVPRVTATNSKTATTGTLKLCKVAGPGIAHRRAVLVLREAARDRRHAVADGARRLLRRC